MASNMQTSLKIVDGPSKEGLKSALFERKQINAFRVKFSVERSFNYEVNVLGVEAEDGSGESWNIKGYAYAMIAGVKIPPPPKYVRIHFRTDRRKGIMTFPY